jgi:hypothetical protein
MTNDPIIQELRGIRRNIEEECQRKGQTYFDYLLEIQEKYKNTHAGHVVDEIDSISMDLKRKSA